MRRTLDELRDHYTGRVAWHRPLHLTARLVRPLALQDPVLLDGVLRAAAAKAHLGRPELAGMPLPDGVSVPLPLAWSTHSAVPGQAPRYPHPLGSLAHADAAAAVPLRLGHPELLEYTQTWHKTWEHSGDDYLVFQNEASKPLRGKLSLASAQYKGWAMSLCVLCVSEAHFWCVGDAEEVARLLEWVPALGKKQSYGYGLVAPGGWTVEECRENWSCTGPTGAPTRPLPVEDWPVQPLGSVRGHGAYRSPAYSSRDWRDVWLPA